MNNLRIRLAALLAALLLLVPVSVLAASPADSLKPLTSHLDVAMAQVQAGNVAGSKAEYDEFDQGWPAVEEGIRQQSPDLYHKIEAGMTNVKAAYATQPPDSSRIGAALKALDTTIDEFLTQYGTPATTPGPAAGQNTAPAAVASAQQSGGVASQTQLLDEAQQRITANDATGAANRIQQFIAGWPSIEGTIATKDQPAYVRIENDMARAYGLLSSTPPDMAQASSVIKEMQSTLTPFAEQPVRYGIFDAAIILLREGFEALLVFAALLAFLKRSGNSAKQGWIWAGGSAGLGISVIIAVVVNIAFGKAGGSSRELLEGVTGLVAAGMLIWMMFWLHSKANVGSWNRYISQRSSRALATNSLLSLALIAFLAVLREGAESVLFYVGIAPAIEPQQLLAGIGAGAAALVILAVLMLVVGVRIPVRPFFLLTSVLVFFLAFKFAGIGVHSLQVAGRVSAHSASFLPASDFFGVFPTWETTVVQLVILAGTGLGLLLTRHEHEPPEHEPASASSQLSGARS